MAEGNAVEVCPRELAALIGVDDLDANRIDRTRNLMDTHLPDALVTGHEPLIAGLALPDPDDRHVLAAQFTTAPALL